MTEGSKYRLYIPQDLAYGANPHPGGAIEPFMALIFDVELIAIKG
jgi:FKBP-type peptidyl-prolyl cis-trans isomerase FklB